MFDRGPYVSFANCGLPYYVGDVIREEDDLLIASPELFLERFNIEVRLHSEVTAIDRERRVIEVRDSSRGESYSENYDELVLSPGSRPIRPDIPGIDLPGIFSLRTIPDSRMLRQWIEDYHATSAVVVGAGYIGLEITENLVQRGVEVTIVEKQNQIMPVLDAETVSPVQNNLEDHGVHLHLNESVAGFAPEVEHTLNVSLASGQQVSSDLVVLCMGVLPENGLARRAGLQIGESGGIRVNQQMVTSDPHVWAIGDAVEVRDVVTGRETVVPLAGPANRQGRIAADAIMGRPSVFRGVQGTSVVGILDQVLAFTGPSEKTLQKLGLWEQMEKVYLHPGHHAGYYPGASPITLKLIFNRQDGRVVGAQAVGEKGVDKRIDVISMAIQKEATVFDLEEAELCYAPQFGSAKDPVNVAGMIAGNVMRGDVSLAHWETALDGDSLILDVRDPSEYEEGHIDGARNLPLNQVRDSLDELSRDREILTYCYVGQRSYYAARALSEYGFTAGNISGGYKTYMLRGKETNQSNSEA